MLNLREKAHFSLEEFKKGRASPVTRYAMPSASEPNSPDEENDELSVLGGKTRLVKKEPNSPRLSGRSPRSLNPVIPLPLSPSTGQMYPDIVEYLHSFRPQPPWGEQHPHHDSSSYEDIDISPASAFGMTTVPGSSTFHPATTSYITPQPQSQVQRQQTQQPFSQSQSSHMVQQQLNVMGNPSASATSGAAFPQYFPVYDYGTSMNGVMNGGVDGHGLNGYSSAAMLDSSTQPEQSSHRRRTSGSPDGNNMQTTWNEFMLASGFM